MLPWNYGFHWTAGSVIFLGAFYSVVVLLAVTVGRVLWKSARAFRTRRVDAIRWHAEFEDLPARGRVCRHELTGEFRKRQCEHAFDCRECETHVKLVAAQPAPHLQAATEDVFGMPYPLDRFYHRGHTWVRPEADGTLTIGLDELGQRMIGRPDQVELPAAGTKLRANSAAWRMRRHGAEARVLAPVDGEVVAAGGPGQGWYLKVRPENGGADLRHLLNGAEVRPWIMREMERVQFALAGATLADGGVLVNDVASAYPRADWDAVCGEVFLEP